MNKIIWISSFPKSGNTWLRYFLANYFFNKEKIFDQKIIRSIQKFPDDLNIFEKIASAKDINLNPYNISKYWIKSQELMQIKKGNVAFLKNHNALVNINNYEFTNKELSLAAIYIVRDPRDVIVSYAKFKNIKYDMAIDHICAKNLLYFKELKKNKFPKVEIIGSWKFNYTSWRDGIPDMPKFFLKYEDLLKNSYDFFYKLISFLSGILNFSINEEQLKLSIEFSNFDKLKEVEKKIGFYENVSTNPFFRVGKSNNWKKQLTNSQISLIEKECGEEMEFLGYL